jgi:hypothetical protein
MAMSSRRHLVAMCLTVVLLASGGARAAQAGAKAAAAASPPRKAPSGPHVMVVDPTPIWRGGNGSILVPGPTDWDPTAGISGGGGATFGGRHCASLRSLGQQVVASYLSPKVAEDGRVLRAAEVAIGERRQLKGWVAYTLSTSELDGVMIGGMGAGAVPSCNVAEFGNTFDNWPGPWWSWPHKLGERECNVMLKAKGAITYSLSLMEFAPVSRSFEVAYDLSTPEKGSCIYFPDTKEAWPILGIVVEVRGETAASTAPDKGKEKLTDLNTKYLVLAPAGVGDGGSAGVPTKVR